MELALSYSHQDAADALQNALQKAKNWDYVTYRKQLAMYSGLDPDTLDETYYHVNTFSPRFMVGTLQTLYKNADQYGKIIDWMKLANPNHYFKLVATDYEIAQKYGQYNHCTATAGIIYTPQPVLLTVFISGLYLESAVGDLAAMAIAYVESGATPTVMPTTTPIPTSSPDAQQQVVEYRNIYVAGGIQIQMDGKEFQPKNARGETVDVFSCDGTTYLPVRALSEALGCEIEWDGQTRTVKITSPKN